MTLFPVVKIGQTLGNVKEEGKPNAKKGIGNPKMKKGEKYFSYFAILSSFGMANSMFNDDEQNCLKKRLSLIDSYFSFTEL